MVLWAVSVLPPFFMCLLQMKTIGNGVCFVCVLRGFSNRHSAPVQNLGASVSLMLQQRIWYDFQVFPPCFKTPLLVFCHLYQAWLILCKTEDFTAILQKDLKSLDFPYWSKQLHYFKVKERKLRSISYRKYNTAIRNNNGDLIFLRPRDQICNSYCILSQPHIYVLNCSSQSTWCCRSRGTCLLDLFWRKYQVTFFHKIWGKHCLYQAFSRLCGDPCFISTPRYKK